MHYNVSPLSMFTNICLNNRDKEKQKQIPSNSDRVVTLLKIDKGAGGDGSSPRIANCKKPLILDSKSGGLAFLRTQHKANCSQAAILAQA